MRLIDADELIEVLNEHGYSTDDYEDDSYDMGVVVGFNNGMIHARHHAHYAKTIDAESVRHANWCHLGGDEWCCSNCDDVIFTEGSWEAPTSKYCQNCGAKMDEEDNT